MARRTFYDVPLIVAALFGDRASTIMDAKQEITAAMSGSLAAATNSVVFNALVTWIQKFPWLTATDAPHGSILIVMQDGNGVAQIYLSPRFSSAAFTNGDIMIAVHDRDAWPIHCLIECCTTPIQASNRAALMTGRIGRHVPIELSGLTPDMLRRPADATSRSKRVRTTGNGAAHEAQTQNMEA